MFIYLLFPLSQIHEGQIEFVMSQTSNEEGREGKKWREGGKEEKREEEEGGRTLLPSAAGLRVARQGSLGVLILSCHTARFPGPSLVSSCLLFS